MQNLEKVKRKEKNKLLTGTCKKNGEKRMAEKKKRMSFYIHPYITNGYYILSSHLHYFRFSFFLYSVKKNGVKKKKEKMPIHSLIIEFRCYKLLLFTLSLSFHFSTMTFTRSVLFSLFLFGILLF
jgi:hypothetical protein